MNKLIDEGGSSSVALLLLLLLPPHDLIVHINKVSEERKKMKK